MTSIRMRRARGRTALRTRIGKVAMLILRQVIAKEALKKSARWVKHESRGDWLRDLPEKTRKEARLAQQSDSPAQPLMRSPPKGFTLVELLVVMSIIALLLTIVAPRYFGRVEQAKETVLKENLSVVRDALDKFYSDSGKYPETLEDLVSKKYLRSLPQDPITESTTTWIIVPPVESDKGAVYDIKSGAQGNARDGTTYADW